VVITKEGAPPALQPATLRWLSDRLPIAKGGRSIISSSLAVTGRYVSNNALFYGEPEEDSSWTQYKPEDRAYQQAVSAREKSAPKFSGVSTPAVSVTPPKTPKAYMQFIKGRPKNVHPQAVMRGVE
jgi:hypothetical protein